MSAVLQEYIALYSDTGIRMGGESIWGASELPKEPAIYFIYDDEGVKYIGQTRNLKQRIANHHKKKELAECNIIWLVVPYKLLNLIESECIATFSPERNGDYRPYAKRYRGRDEGAWLTIRIKMTDEQAEDLESVADVLGRSIYDVVYLAIDAYLERQREAGDDTSN